VSDVQTPPQEQPPTQPAQRHCPRCGAPMTEEQEWCLTCGAAVGTRVVAAPGWRAPLIAAGVIAVIAAIAIAVAIIQLADDTDQVAQNPQPTPQVTPPPATTPTPDPTLMDPNATPTPAPGATTTPTPEPTTTPEPTSTPDTGGGSGSVGSWPAGESGWTVVLASTTSQSSADDKAQRFADDGIADVGVLNSDDFGSLKAGYWVVYSGQYDSQAAARDALDGIDASDAYVRRIAPN